MKNKLNMQIVLKNTFFFLCLALYGSSCFSQALNEEDNNLLYSDIIQKPIIALGDATHSDYAASKLRVDLMKDLIENHNYTIIAVESNLYELYKAYEDFKTSSNIKELNTSIYRMVQNEHLDELFFYIKDQNEKGKNIKVFGFDSNLSADDSHAVLTQAMQKNLKKTEIECEQVDFESFSKAFKRLTPTNLKALLRTTKDYTTVYDYLSCYLNQEEATDDSNEVLHKALANLHVNIEDRNNGKLSDVTRDSLMFNNIAYLKDKYPQEKMILFGSTSHFIKSPNTISSKYLSIPSWKSLGQRLNEAYPQEYFFIAYTLVSGNTRGYFGKKVKLSKLKANSIENTVDQRYDSNDHTMYLSINRDKPTLDNSDTSRMMGNTFMEMDIASNVDGLFLIRNANMD
ncbi:erythromycin esterase family protein [Myroides sp. LJL116]